MQRYNLVIVGFIDAITSVANPRCLDDSDEWCAGLPLVNVRMLDDNELGLLRQQVVEQFRQQRVISFFASIGFVCTYLATVFFPQPITIAAMSAAATLMVVFVVWLFSDPSSWLRRYKALQVDLTSGVVHCFESTLCTSTLDVLPRSEVVYKSNNLSPAKWHTAQITAVAKTPPISSIASEWLMPVIGIGGRFFSGKRALSSAEKAEVRRLAGQPLDQRRRHAVTYVGWLFVLSWLSHWSNPDLFYIALAFTGYTVSLIVAEIRQCFALNRDAEEGHVVINCRATGDGVDLRPIGAPAEFLPSARLKWTENGTPADWRKQI